MTCDPARLAFEPGARVKLSPCDTSRYALESKPLPSHGTASDGRPSALRRLKSFLPKFSPIITPASLTSET